MAHKIIWSPEALQQLEEITHYISRDSEVYAAKTATKIVDAADNLALFPFQR